MAMQRWFLAHALLAARVLALGTAVTTAPAVVSPPVAGNSAGSGYILSKSADCSTDDRVFSPTDTVHVLVWSDQLDAKAIKKAEWQLQDGNNNRIKRSLAKMGNGTFTDSFDLGGLPSPATSWAWRVKLQDKKKTYSASDTIIISVGGGSAPGADFTAAPLAGTAPLTVDFTDLSSGSPTFWSWSFGDGSGSGAKDPSHVYDQAGTYSVSLTAANATGSDTLTRDAYVVVSEGGLAGEGFILSKSADFSSDDRAFATGDTIHMLLWSDGVDVTKLKKSEWELRDAKKNKVKQSLTIHADGTASGSFSLADLPSTETAWTWKGSLQDKSKNSYKPSVIVTVTPGGPGPQADTLAFDFQDAGSTTAQGFVAVVPGDSYSAAQGHGFLAGPEHAVDSSGHTWKLFARTVSVDQAVPGSVLFDATRDCVASAAAEMRFRVDVPPGSYDVTLWLGDVTTPRHQVRATVNGVVVDVDRMDINHLRNSFDQAVFGNAVPRRVRVDASAGWIEAVVGSHPSGSSPITWTYLQDEVPNTAPVTKTATLVPAFSEACLQALSLHPAADPPLLLQQDGSLALGAAPADPALLQALVLFNAGDIAGARAAFDALAGSSLQAARAAGLFWVAGHPALRDDETALLGQAEAGLAAVLAADPADYAAQDLLLEVRIALDAERFRSLLGYASADAPAAENLGRSCSLVEGLGTDQAYYRKGQILWLRNRGGLDPRRVTVSWERAQWLAQQLDPQWGAVNPYLHLYATDVWQSDGDPWTMTDWPALIGAGPAWATSQVIYLNSWLDLFEWWAIHRQSVEGDLGGGWSDDVELMPAFALMAFALGESSDIVRDSVLRFADGIWNSPVIDAEAGFQAQYGDVQHTAEPTGNLLHLMPMMRPGDPESLERILKSGKTFRDVFLTDSPGGHRHFKGNNMSATQIALNANHQADIPVCGRVTAPFPFLVWYSDNPGMEQPLRAWLDSWLGDAARTDYGKPVGVFPQAVWTPTDEIGYPGSGNWWSASAQHGQLTAFPQYQEYLYNLAGFFFVRTGEAMYRQPFDKLSEYAVPWHKAGRPALPSAPPTGDEAFWCGGKLGVPMQGATINVAAATGLPDWSGYLARFAFAYGQYRDTPTDPSPLEKLATRVTELRDSWPYRTTEGVMTDRILITGWFDLVSFYIGAESRSVFRGMPVQAVTWDGTTRFFAAAVSTSTATQIDATAFLFSDTDRTVTLRCWQLEPGASYQLEAGPAAGLGMPPSTVTQTVSFQVEHRGEGVSFVLPGRTVYGLQIQQTSAPPSPAPLRADLAVAARDVSYDADLGQLTVRVHNVGSADATNVSVVLVQGADPSGPVIGASNLALLEAPVDLVPRAADVVFTHDGSSPVTIRLDPSGSMDEVQLVNNVATAWIGATSPDLPPPMLLDISPASVAGGSPLYLSGRGFHPNGIALLNGEPTALLALVFLDDQHLQLTVSDTLGAGLYLVSVRNPDGKDSNLVPITVTG